MFLVYKNTTEICEWGIKFVKHGVFLVKHGFEFVNDLFLALNEIKKKPFFRKKQTKKDPFCRVLEKPEVKVNTS